MFGNKLFLGMLAMGMLRFEADGGGGSGGGGAPDPAKELADLKATLSAKDKEIETLKAKGGKTDPVHDDDLRKKAELERNKKESEQAGTKAIESALQFTMGMETFLKDNKDIFPSEISEIVTVANKETYDTVADKANAVKAAVIQSYFLVQENLDQLTKSQKENVAEFLKLSKTGRELKAASLYDSVFEPAIEMHKRVKKADELAKANKGYASQGGVMGEYKKRLVESSKKAFINRRKGNE